MRLFVLLALPFVGLACRPSPPEATPATPPEATPAPNVPVDSSGLVRAFRAMGNEPFWSATVTDGSDTDGRVEYTRLGEDSVTVEVERLADAKGVTYTGTLRGAPFVLGIRGIRCADTMADTTYEFTATLDVGVETLSGCAVALR